MTDRIDLRGASVDAVIAFVFDHPEPRAIGEEWYRQIEIAEIQADPTEQVRHLAHILRTAGDLSSRFSLAQIEQGFWFMFLSGDRCFALPLADDGIPWPERRSCIRAIYGAYEGLFVREPLNETAYMLWDLLLHAWNFRPPREVSEAMFETLVRILALPSEECQRAALHGLGHLRHPGTRGAVSAFLERSQERSQALRRYAEHVRNGDETL